MAQTFNRAHVLKNEAKNGFEQFRGTASITPLCCGVIDRTLAFHTKDRGSNPDQDNFFSLYFTVFIHLYIFFLTSIFWMAILATLKTFRELSAAACQFSSDATGVQCAQSAARFFVLLQVFFLRSLFKLLEAFSICFLQCFLPRLCACLYILIPATRHSANTRVTRPVFATGCCSGAPTVGGGRSVSSGAFQQPDYWYRSGRITCLLCVHRSTTHPSTAR